MVTAAWAATAGPAPRDFAVPGGHPVADVAFTPDGRGLVAAAADGTVVRWDLATGRATSAARLGPFPAHAAPEFAVGPTGRRVAVGSSAGPPRVFDAATGAPAATLPRPLADADAWF